VKAKSKRTDAAKPVKQLIPKTSDGKYMGNEILWEKMPEPDQRKTAQLRAFSWYNSYYDTKDVRQFVIDWMSRTGCAVTDCRRIARCPDRSFPLALGWLCRMSLVGWQLDQREKNYIVDTIQHLLAQEALAAQAEDKDEKPAAPRPNIQDHLREKMLEAGGEIEGMFDRMVAAGAKMSADYKPMSVLREFNVSPQMVGEIAAHWQIAAKEFAEAAQGRDPMLAEGYAAYTKIQLRNMIRFAEQVAADCASYVQIKKVERKPRKKKPVSPEKLTARFRYLREFAELGLKSVPVTDLVNAQEAWLYDVKNRKLIYVVHDALVGSFSVKGSSLIGFDPTQSVRKTLRKPKEQIKALMSAGAPAARKVFKEIRSTETKFNGRGNENMILLRVR